MGVHRRDDWKCLLRLISKSFIEDLPYHTLTGSIGYDYPGEVVNETTLYSGHQTVLPT